MAEPFDIERLMDGSGRVDLSDIDWSDVPNHPITPEGLRTLRYFLMTEGSTVFYAKGLMQTRAIYREPEFAPFLCVWMYEEEFHGRAFRKFLEAYGERIDRGYRGEMFLGRGASERIQETGQNALSVVFPDAWPAVHMVWGAIQEYTTYTAYQALIDRIDHPILNVICQRIMKQELKHYAFYNTHAKRRLAESAVARRLAAEALKLAWVPVGQGMCSEEDACHAIRFLFDGLEGDAIAAVERKVRTLPGLEWFDLFTKYAEKNRIRAAPRAWFSPAASVRAASPSASAGVA
jgi:hypothetical protein